MKLDLEPDSVSDLETEVDESSVKDEDSSDEDYKDQPKTNARKETKTPGYATNLVFGTGYPVKEDELRIGDQLLVPIDERNGFDKVSSAELVAALTQQGLGVTDSKVELCNRLHDREPEAIQGPTAPKLPGNGGSNHDPRPRFENHITMPLCELDSYLATTLTNLKEQLKANGLGLSGRKIEVWYRLKENGVEPGELKPPAGGFGPGAVGRRPSAGGAKEPGNGNFKKVSQQRTIGRDELDEEELIVFDNTTVLQLRQALRDIGLPVSGNKRELWARRKEAEGLRFSVNEGDNEEGKDEGLKSEDGNKDGNEILNQAHIYPNGIGMEGMPNVPRQDARVEIEDTVMANTDEAAYSIDVMDTDIEADAVDYYIRQSLLDMTISQIRELANGAVAAGFVPSCAQSTFAEYLRQSPGQRFRLAQLRHLRRSPLQALEEPSHDWPSMIPSGFSRMYFIEVLDWTPWIWQLLESAEDNGIVNIWAMQNVPPERQGFHIGLLTERRFGDVMGRYPRLAKFLNDCIDDGDLQLEDPDERELVADTISAWQKRPYKFELGTIKRLDLYKEWI